MTLNLPLLYWFWFVECCQTSPNKSKSRNLWHVTWGKPTPIVSFCFCSLFCFLSVSFECLRSKIQQTKMLVMCQRFGDLFLFGLVWQYSTNQNQYNKGRFKVFSEGSLIWTLDKLNNVIYGRFLTIFSQKFSLEEACIEQSTRVLLNGFT